MCVSYCEVEKWINESATCKGKGINTFTIFVEKLHKRIKTIVSALKKIEIENPDKIWITDKNIWG